MLFKDKRLLRKKEGVCAIDAVKLLINGEKKYENFGRITYWKDGKLIKEKGYKLVFNRFHLPHQRKTAPDQTHTDGHQTTRHPARLVLAALMG